MGYRVRFDEAGPDGFVRPAVLLAMAQDCAWLHSNRLGFNRAWYASRGLTWLVRAVRLDLRAAIWSGSKLCVRTEIVGFRPASARRRTEITVSSGATLGEPDPIGALVETDWALTDQDGHPARVPPELLERFTAAGDSLEASFAPIRVRSRPPSPLDDVAVAPAILHERIRWSDADPMAHLNNGRALDLVDEALASSPAAVALLRRFPRQYCVEYRTPLALGLPLVLTVRPSRTVPGSAGWDPAFTVELRAAELSAPAVVALVGVPTVGDPA